MTRLFPQVGGGIEDDVQRSDLLRLDIPVHQESLAILGRIVSEHISDASYYSLFGVWRLAAAFTPLQMRPERKLGEASLACRPVCDNGRRPPRKCSFII